MAIQENNPEVWAKVSVPFENTEEANAALNAFYDEVYALREKYKLQNVSIIIMDATADGGPVLSDSHFGSSMNEEAMAAWHFGRASEARQKMILDAVSLGSANAIKTPRRGA